jgi:hypothetical protein
VWLYALLLLSNASSTIDNEAGQLTAILSRTPLLHTRQEE